MGEPSETLDSTMALDETFPVDSEKPDKEHIFTSRNECAAPSHYSTQKLPDIGEVQNAQETFNPNALIYREGTFPKRPERYMIKLPPQDQEGG